MVHKHFFLKKGAFVFFFDLCVVVLIYWIKIIYISGLYMCTLIILSHLNDTIVDDLYLHYALGYIRYQCDRVSICICAITRF